MNYDSISQALADLNDSAVITLVASRPAAGLYRKIRAERSGNRFRVTYYTQTQVFHKTAEAAVPLLLEALSGAFRQGAVWLEDGRVLELLVSKKGKVHVTVRQEQPPQTQTTAHNRQKSYLIQEGMLVPPLADMGVMTPEGKILHAKYDKFRQINRFLEMIDDAIPDDPPDRPLRIVDFGCGKAYLTFVLYYYFTQLRKFPVEMIGLDLKADVIQACTAAAEKYGYQNLHFSVGRIEDYVPDGQVDMVITLHACDTATDYALYHAVQWGAGMIFSVPCCQHEVNQSIQSDRLAMLTRYGIVKERFSALLTDAMRADLLEYCGYKTQLLEFIDWEHTPKNIMIRAVRRSAAAQLYGKSRAKYLAEVDRALEEFQVKPTLYRLLEADGKI